jgi:pimeloyl-ACP methyl ester carboxylesterase
LLGTQLNGQVIVLPDGRKLGYTKIGKGTPVIYFHGTSSSRLEVLLLKNLANNAQLQLIGVDRPGYGLSSYKPRKNLQDFNDDINCLATYLGFERFAVLGWSGGGVFALSYCAYNPNRVTKLVLVGAPSLPFDVSTAHNMPLARYIMKLPYVGELAMRQLSRQLLKANGDTKAFLATPQGKQLLHGASSSDLTFFNNLQWLSQMYHSMAEAFHQGNIGVKAVVDEHQIFVKPWDLPFSAINGENMWIWHGAQDLTCRVNNAYEIAKVVPNSKLEIFSNSGHCVMFEHIERLSSIFSQN